MESQSLRTVVRKLRQVVAPLEPFGPDAELVARLRPSSRPFGVRTDCPPARANGVGRLSPRLARPGRCGRCLPGDVSGSPAPSWLTAAARPAGWVAAWRRESHGTEAPGDSYGPDDSGNRTLRHGSARVARRNGVAASCGRSLTTNSTGCRRSCGCPRCFASWKVTRSRTRRGRSAGRRERYRVGCSGRGNGFAFGSRPAG